MEVLKKMMHHHTFTLFHVSGGCRGVSVARVRACVCLSSRSSCMGAWDEGCVNIVCKCVCVKMLTVCSSSQAGGRHYSLQPSVREPISI